MFCKWCGGSIVPTDRECKHCGREIPALSDCGGFYDIVPQAVDKVPELKRDVRVLPAPSDDEELKVDPVSVEKKPEPKNARLVPWLITVIIILTMGLVVAVLVVSSLKRQVESLSESVAGLIQEYDRIESNDNEFDSKVEQLPHFEENSSEEYEGNVEKESEEESEDSIQISDLNAAFTVDCTEGSGKADFGEFGGIGADCNITYNDETGKPELAVFSSSEYGDLLELAFSYEDVMSSKSLKVNCGFSMLFFGFSGEPEVSWKYRIKGDNEWKDVQDATLSVSPLYNDNKISVKTDDLRDLLEGRSDTIELLFEMRRENSAGGSQFITVEGLEFVLDEVENTDEGKENQEEVDFFAEDGISDDVTEDVSNTDDLSITENETTDPNG